MIAIVSSSASERAAISAVLAARGWPGVECNSVREFTRFRCRHTPAIVVVRHQLVDGYSDDVITALAAAAGSQETKIVVVMTADASADTEARQVALGADCVQRDPVRTSVLAEFLAKYLRTPRRKVDVARSRLANDAVRFAGALLCRTKHTVVARGKTASLTPREFALADLLAEARETVTYETLYSEILGRRFMGDTSNMRVLLAKLATSVAPLGLDLRRHVEVFPKLGYRYHRAPRIVPPQ